MDLAGFSLLSLAFAMGVRHAFDADHLAAIIAMVSHNDVARKPWFTGLMWGAGHATALLLIGLIFINIDSEIPQWTSHLFEFGAATVVMFLGVRLFSRAFRADQIHLHTHNHGQKEHAHPHMHRTGHDQMANEESQHAIHLQPYAVGVLHGLAGSAAMLLVLLSKVPDYRIAIAYVIVFSIGAAVAMVGMSVALAMPLLLDLGNRPVFSKIFRLLAGSASTAVGISLMGQVLIDAGIQFG